MTIKCTGFLASAALAVLAAGSAIAAQDAVAPNIAAAVSDSARPPLDRFRDDRRKPAETLEFAGVKPGMRVAELIPGSGYYTRLLSRAVGPGGKVYTIPFTEPRAAQSRALAQSPEYTNVQLVTTTPGNLALPEPVDLVWTTQNYHDLRTQAALINNAVFNALKPGGVYLVVDHAARPGAREESVALHRIDEAIVKQDVMAAGFVPDGEGDFLRNPNDDRSRQVMERELNRQTDQFVLRFRKPTDAR